MPPPADGPALSPTRPEPRTPAKAAQLYPMGLSPPSSAETTPSGLGLRASHSTYLYVFIVLVHTASFIYLPFLASDAMYRVLVRREGPWKWREVGGDNLFDFPGHGMYWALLYPGTGAPSGSTRTRRRMTGHGRALWTRGSERWRIMIPGGSPPGRGLSARGERPFLWRVWEQTM